MIISRRDFVRSAIVGSSYAAVLGSGSLSQALATDSPATPDTGNNACNTLLSHELRPLMGPTRQPLCDQYANQVLLIVNTASKCGFTPQFESLEILHQQYSDQGFKVLGFPSGDFRQELESEAEVAQFCELNYGVSFPMFEKIHVTGDHAHPLYKALAEATGSYPKWNFNKYLVNRNGTAVSHYNSSILPTGDQIVGDIEALL